MTQRPLSVGDDVRLYDNEGKLLASGVIDGIDDYWVSFEDGYELALPRIHKVERNN